MDPAKSLCLLILCGPKGRRELLITILNAFFFIYIHMHFTQIIMTGPI